MVPTFMVPWGCPEDIGNNSGEIDICILSQYICTGSYLFFGNTLHFGTDNITCNRTIKIRTKSQRVGNTLLRSFKDKELFYQFPGFLLFLETQMV